MFTIHQLRYQDILHIEIMEIKSEEITCIIGESGSGKSTFLKLLNQMISQDSGDIYYKSRPIQEYNPILLRREVAMLSQQPVIFEGTMKDNLLMGCKFAEKSFPSDEDITEVLKIVHLDKSLNDDPNQFSGGEKQRLALARLLLLDPPVLLLDEPTSALDQETEDFVMSNLLHYAKRRKKTVVMVTHSLNAAEKYADTIIEIEKKRIVGGLYE
ncbi:ABC transporter ATP-binding protein [Bacillus alveayuensis]|jgi:putative ABC transport system ATP-binding protein|uniref:ABC transporter ATP-binding protein n=1 Tax=Aeribacillus alveayuensis TaxID=279215 RepID=UPI0005D11B8F|nr:ATP-binding cassette domain-containing protein [Bacillus alveayuensis]